MIRLPEMEEEDVRAPLAPDDEACKGEGVEAAHYDSEENK